MYIKSFYRLLDELFKVLQLYFDILLFGVLWLILGIWSCCAIALRILFFEERIIFTNVNRDLLFLTGRWFFLRGYAFWLFWKGKIFRCLTFYDIFLDLVNLYLNIQLFNFFLLFWVSALFLLRIVFVLLFIFTDIYLKLIELFFYFSYFIFLVNDSVDYFKSVLIFLLYLLNFFIFHIDNFFFFIFDLI